FRAAQFMQMGWWVVLAVAAAIWVRPEGWAGAVAAVVAAAWYYGSERMDGTEQQQRPPSATFAWSGVGLIAVVACLAWLDVVALKTSPPDGLLWIALALFLPQTGNQVTRAVRFRSRRGVQGHGASGPPRYLHGRVLALSRLSPAWHGWTLLP